VDPARWLVAVYEGNGDSPGAGTLPTPRPPSARTRGAALQACRGAGREADGVRGARHARGRALLPPPRFCWAASHNVMSICGLHFIGFYLAASLDSAL